MNFPGRIVLSACNRLREPADFHVAVKGKRAGGKLLVIHVAQPEGRRSRPPRVGFVVSKAVGIAVVRNRVKRRLRHSLRARISSFPQGVDLVVRANPASAQVDFLRLDTELECLLTRVMKDLNEVSVGHEKSVMG
nr:ribonuclease P protein component [Dermatophilus congolensis]